MLLTLYAQRGINMVEILVTLVITAVGLLGRTPHTAASQSRRLGFW